MHYWFTIKQFPQTLTFGVFKEIPVLIYDFSYVRQWRIIGAYKRNNILNLCVASRFKCIVHAHWRYFSNSLINSLFWIISCQKIFLQSVKIFFKTFVIRRNTSVTFSLAIGNALFAWKRMAWCKFNVLMTVSELFKNTCVKLTIFFHFDIDIQKSSFLIRMIESEFYGIMIIIDFRNEIMQVLFTMIPYHKMSSRNLNQIKSVLSQEPTKSISSLPINKDA